VNGSSEVKLHLAFIFEVSDLLAVFVQLIFGVDHTADGSATIPSDNFMGGSTITNAAKLRCHFHLFPPSKKQPSNWLLF
jgi:hypothetical protein